MKKSLQSMDVQPQVKMILNTLLERCKKEKENRRLQVPLDNFIERGSYYTALPATLLSELYVSEKGISLAASHITISTMIAISGSLEEYYSKGHFPKIADIFQCADEINETFKKTMSIETFASLLSRLGYLYKATIPSDNLLLMEKPELTFDRTMFLKKLYKLRKEEVNILYLGERVIDLAYKFKKVMPEYKHFINKEEFLENELILYLIVSKKGIEHYYFTNNTSSKEFFKWFEVIVLPSLGSNNAIILENNPIHPKGSHSKISEYHSKSEMLSYLKDHRIPCSSDMNKAELFQLIKCCMSKNNNRLEQLLHAYGQELLFLPKNYESLSMMDLLWEYVNKNVEKDPTHLIQLKERLENILTNQFTPAHWETFSEKIIKQEGTLRTIDTNIEKAIDKNFKFRTDENSDEGYLTLINSTN